MGVRQAGVNRLKSRMLERAHRATDLSSQSHKMFWSSEREDGYHTHNAANETVKKSHRERIAGHFTHWCRRLSKKHRSRCFSLPGKRWQFESLLLSKRKNRRWKFVAVERRPETLEFGRRYMPRINGSAGWIQHAGFDIATTDICSAVHGNLLGVMSAIRSSEDLSHVCGQWDCFWWDLQGPLLTIDMARAAALLPACLNKNRDIIPFAITFMIGRETVEWESSIENSLDARVHAYATQLKTHEWKIRVPFRQQYCSTNGAPMGLMMGCIHRDY